MYIANIYLVVWNYVHDTSLEVITYTIAVFHGPVKMCFCTLSCSKIINACCMLHAKQVTYVYLIAGETM